MYSSQAQWEEKQKLSRRDLFIIGWGAMIGNGTVLVLSEGIPKFFQGASLGQGPKTMAGWVAEGQRLRVPGVVQRGAGVRQVVSLGRGQQAPIG